LQLGLTDFKLVINDATFNTSYMYVKYNNDVERNLYQSEQFVNVHA